MLDDILGVVTCLGKVILIQRAGHTSLGEINLGKKGFSGIVVDAVIDTNVRILRKQLHSLLKGHYDIFIDIGFLNLLNVIVVSGLDGLGVVVDDRNVSECPDEEEVSHRFP